MHVDTESRKNRRETEWTLNTDILKKPSVELKCVQILICLHLG